MFNEKFVEKFRLKELKIKEIGTWCISLRPEQITIGSLLLSLNRDCDKLSLLTKVETKDLGVAFKTIDSLLINTFKPDKINYLALMMIDSQVHFHIIPRYQKDRYFSGLKFTDEAWPYPPTLQALEIDILVLYNILGFFRECK